MPSCQNGDHSKNKDIIYSSPNKFSSNSNRLIQQRQLVKSDHRNTYALPSSTSTAPNRQAINPKSNSYSQQKSYEIKESSDYLLPKSPQNSSTLSKTSHNYSHNRNISQSQSTACKSPYLRKGQQVLINSPSQTSSSQNPLLSPTTVSKAEIPNHEYSLLDVTPTRHKGKQQMIRQNQVLQQKNLISYQQNQYGMRTQIKGAGFMINSFAPPSSSTMNKHKIINQQLQQQQPMQQRGSSSSSMMKKKIGKIQTATTYAQNSSSSSGIQKQIVTNNTSSTITRQLIKCNQKVPVSSSVSSYAFTKQHQQHQQHQFINPQQSKLSQQKSNNLYEDIKSRGIMTNYTASSNLFLKSNPANYQQSAMSNVASGSSYLGLIGQKMGYS